MLNTQSVAPKDLDALLSVDEFLAWLGKEPNKSTRFWANKNARSFAESRGKSGIPAHKFGKEWRFHPRTILKHKGATC